MEKYGNVCRDQYGNILHFNHRYTDWNGNPVERTPDEYRYSYDAYVIKKIKDDYEDCVYSDRLRQWDWDKHKELVKKHFGNEGQLWHNREFSKIEAFLRDFFDLPNLTLVGVMEGCNVSNGYPYWIFMFDRNKNDKK